MCSDVGLRATKSGFGFVIFVLVLTHSLSTLACYVVLRVSEYKEISAAVTACSVLLFDAVVMQ